MRTYDRRSAASRASPCPGAGSGTCTTARSPPPSPSPAGQPAWEMLGYSSAAEMRAAIRSALADDAAFGAYGAEYDDVYRYGGFGPGAATPNITCENCSKVLGTTRYPGCSYICDNCKGSDGPIFFAMKCGRKQRNASSPCLESIRFVEVAGGKTDVFGFRKVIRTVPSLKTICEGVGI